MHDVAYAAGVMDSDGSFGGYLSGKNEILQLIVVVGVVDGRLPLWLAERWGGKVRVVRKDATNPKWRTMYRWELCGLRAAEFAAAVLPYLVIKGEQAAIFAELSKTVSPGGKRLSPEAKATRRTLVAELKRLKRV